MYYRCTNNGVTALVTEDTYQQILLMQPRQAGPYPRPIFTFARPDLVLYYRPYLTGTYGMMDQLLGGRSTFENDFYVPFSNLHEINAGADERIAELMFCTTFEQLVKAFDLEFVVRAATAI
jgi:hypothetical protein